MHSQSASASATNLVHWRTHIRTGAREHADICARSGHPHIPIRTCTSLSHCKRHVQSKQSYFRRDTLSNSLLPESHCGIRIRPRRCTPRSRCTRARHASLGTAYCSRLRSAKCQGAAARRRIRLRRCQLYTRDVTTKTLDLLTGAVPHVADARSRSVCQQDASPVPRAPRRANAGAVGA